MCRTFEWGPWFGELQGWNLWSDVIHGMSHSLLPNRQHKCVGSPKLGFMILIGIEYSYNAPHKNHYHDEEPRPEILPPPLDPSLNPNYGLPPSKWVTVTPLMEVVEK